MGASVHLPARIHGQVHDEFGSEDDRAGALLDAAREQDALRDASWAGHPDSAREAAEAHAAARLRHVPCRASGDRVHRAPQ
jgi:hypothetical protein